MGRREYQTYPPRAVHRQGANVGFLESSLLDFSFSTLITPTIIKAVYVIVTIVATLIASAFLVLDVRLGGDHVWVGIIAAPVGWLLST